jgi:hypothetical protein
MQKLLLTLAGLALVAAGCNSSTQNLRKIESGPYGQTVSNEFEGELNSFEGVDVLAPIKGEKIKAGSTFTIRWNFSIPQNVTIALESTKGDVKILADEIPNTGSYAWQVAEIPSDDYRIQVYPAGARERVGYSDMFSIVQ